jgi:hypothetical protein
MSNGGHIAGFLNLANQINQIPIYWQGKCVRRIVGFLKRNAPERAKKRA